LRISRSPCARKEKIVVLQSRDHRNACELEFVISAA
jgi:hypothetical protein